VHAVDRRRFLTRASGAALAAVAHQTAMSQTEAPEITLFVCGDVMTGRGVDQILPHPGDPRLHERYMGSARGYVDLAEAHGGAIRKPVDYAYVWGDTPAEIAHAGARMRIVNLETAVTTSEDAWPGKSIHYRMHPDNVPCLTAARIDCCTLANNHVLDWGYRGLAQTLATLHAAGIATAGAGNDQAQAEAPAVLRASGDARVLVFAFGTASAGVPREWAARGTRGGVSYLDDLSMRTLDTVAQRVAAHKRGGDLAVASIHWGANWGYEVSDEARAFAHALIDRARISLVLGHSSHHPKGIEIYRGRQILYGCGDYLDDYEGIGGHESFRPELALAYFPTFDMASGRFARFIATPMEIRNLRTVRASRDDARWLADRLDRESAPFGTVLARREDDRIAVRGP
jgi:poly-gamma-glutamate synthesis protein (capsule biosynthesis protein)